MKFQDLRMYAHGRDLGAEIFGMKGLGLGLYTFGSWCRASGLRLLGARGLINLLRV